MTLDQWSTVTLVYRNQQTRSVVRYFGVPSSHLPEDRSLLITKPSSWKRTIIVYFASENLSKSENSVCFCTVNEFQQRTSDARPLQRTKQVSILKILELLAVLARRTQRPIGEVQLLPSQIYSNLIRSRSIFIFVLPITLPVTNRQRNASSWKENVSRRNQIEFAAPYLNKKINSEASFDQIIKP